MAGSQERRAGRNRARSVWVNAQALATGAALLLASATAWAHDDAEELGHHWEVPAYAAEIRLQLAAIAVLTCLVLGTRYFSSLRRRREAR